MSVLWNCLWSTIQKEAHWWGTKAYKKDCDSQMGKKVMCVNVNVHNKQMAGNLNTRPTASAFLALVLDFGKNTSRFAIWIYVRAGLTGNKKGCKIQ